MKNITVSLFEHNFISRISLHKFCWSQLKPIIWSHFLHILQVTFYIYFKIQPNSKINLMLILLNISSHFRGSIFLRPTLRLGVTAFGARLVSPIQDIRGAFSALTHTRRKSIFALLLIENCDKFLLMISCVQTKRQICIERRLRHIIFCIFKWSSYIYI